MRAILLFYPNYQENQHAPIINFIHASLLRHNVPGVVQLPALASVTECCDMTRWLQTMAIA
jgi:hypothetical protein